MNEISIIILFILSFFGTFYAMPHSIRKLSENGHMVKDMYKKDNPLIPTNAGIIVLFVSYISISIYPLLARIINQSESVLDFSIDLKTDYLDVSLAFLLVVSIFSFYGLVDDLVDINRLSKTIIPVTFSFPLVAYIHPSEIWVPFIGEIDLNQALFPDILLSDLFRLLVIPLYVMVVSNLVNMHSGYNGLQSGLSIILILALMFESWQDGILEYIVPVGAFLGSMTVLFWFNKYPSRVFEGNIGSLLFGSIIGSLIVIQKYWWFGFFILIPHTINFILWIWWLYLIKKSPEKQLDSNNSHSKFGTLSEDGTITVPNYLTVKWISNYYFRLNEKQATSICYFYTIAFCICGIYIF